MEAALISFGVIFLAELGDKSQLMVLAFATRYRPLPVLVGVSLGAALLNGMSVGVGAVAATALPTRVLALAGGLTFLAFSAWALWRPGADDGAPDVDHATGSAVAAVALAFLLAELGDKTMIVAVTLATQASPWGTWVGATLAIVAADGLAIAAGRSLGTRLSPRAVRLASAGAFLVFGILLLASAVSD